MNSAGQVPNQGNRPLPPLLPASAMAHRGGGPSQDHGLGAPPSLPPPISAPGPSIHVLLPTPRVNTMAAHAPPRRDSDMLMAPLHRILPSVVTASVSTKDAGSPMERGQQSGHIILLRLMLASLELRSLLRLVRLGENFGYYRERLLCETCESEFQPRGADLEIPPSSGVRQSLRVQAAMRSTSKGNHSDKYADRPSTN